MLWNDINPILEFRFFNIEFDDFLERCFVVGLPVESLSDILNIIDSS
jgi:hypothetical protein